MTTPPGGSHLAKSDVPTQAQLELPDPALGSPSHLSLWHAWGASSSGSGSECRRRYTRKKVDAITDSAMVLTNDKLSSIHCAV